MLYFTLITFNNQLLYKIKPGNKNIEKKFGCEAELTHQNTCIYNCFYLQNHRLTEIKEQVVKKKQQNLVFCNRENIV